MTLQRLCTTTYQNAKLKSRLHCLLSQVLLNDGGFGCGLSFLAPTLWWGGNKLSLNIPPVTLLVDWVNQAGVVQVGLIHVIAAYGQRSGMATFTTSFCNTFLHAPLIGGIQYLLFSSAPPSNSHISVSDP